MSHRAQDLKEFFFFKLFQMMSVFDQVLEFEHPDLNHPFNPIKIFGLDHFDSLFEI